MKTTSTLNRLIDFQCSILAPKSDLLPDKFAEDNIILDRSTTSSPGPFRFDARPWQRAMVNAPLKPGVRKTTFVMPVQIAKTTILNLLISYFIAQEPAPMMLVAPSEKDLSDWIDGKLEKMFEQTACVRKLIGRVDGKRRPGQRKATKVFPGGVMFTGSASSPKALRGRAVRVLVLDEIDGYPRSSGREGDPLKLAHNRCTDFHNKVIVQASTPTDAETSRILAQYEEGNGQLLYVACPHCKEIQTLTWSQMRWEKGKPETARYHCSHCDVGLTDRERIHAIENAENEGGGWIATRPHIKDHESFRINGLYRTTGESGNYLEVFVKNYLAARAGGTDTYKAWVNTFLAEGWVDEGEVITPDPLFDRREDYSLTTVPKGVLYITAGADTQQDREEVSFIGHGYRDEKWHLGHERIEAAPGTTAWEAGLDECSTRKFNHPVLGTIEVSKLYIDAGGFQKEVFDYAKNPARRDRVQAIHGSRNIKCPPLKKPVKQGQSGVWTIEVGVNGLKNTLFNALAVTTPGPHYMHFPLHPIYDRVWFAQLCAERRNKEGRWEKVKGRRNEALDCTIYAIAAFHGLKKSARDVEEAYNDMLALAKEQELATPEEKPAEAPTAPAPAAKPDKPKGLSMADIKRMAAETAAENAAAEKKESEAARKQRELEEKFNAGVKGRWANAPKAKWAKAGAGRSGGNVWGVMLT